MEKICTLLTIFLFASILCAQRVETFSDYTASSEDFALRQLSKELKGKADSLLGQCLDSIFAGNIEAVLDLSNEVIKLKPDGALGYCFHSRRCACSPVVKGEGRGAVPRDSCGC